MRVVVIGSESERAQLRKDLEGGPIEIVGEAGTIAEGHGAGADALVVARSNGEPAFEKLTVRESEVLDLLAQGLANKAIAARLAISEHTVKFHLASICAKLGAENRTDAVRRAVRGGLVAL